ncbi:hypothetical protein D3C72_2021420 [compost metagenome]
MVGQGKCGRIALAVIDDDARHLAHRSAADADHPIRRPVVEAEAKGARDQHQPRLALDMLAGHGDQLRDQRILVIAVHAQMRPGLSQRHRLGRRRRRRK